MSLPTASRRSCLRSRLSKVGWVKALFHRPLEGTAKNITVSRTKGGKYYVSVQCELELAADPSPKPAVGVDLGPSHFATLSTGEKIESPRFLQRAERRLRRLHRQLSRRRKGSSNREKARLLLARQYERVTRKRADFLHRLSHRLTSEYGLIRFEDLNVAGMLKNHSLAQGIADSGWSMFAQMCEYKAAQRGVRVFYVDRFYPSSKACHVCGLVNEDLKLSDRTWTCPGCGTKHDRDENAAINLLNAPTVGATGRKRLGRQRKTRDKRAAVVEPGSQGASSPW